MELEHRGENVKKAGEFLRSIQKEDVMIKRKMEQIERLRSLVEYKGIKFNDTGGGKTSGDFRGDSICKMLDLEKSLNEDINRLIKHRDEAMKMIDTLSNADMVNILYLKYLDYKSWQEVAYEISKSVQWTLELNKRALNILDRRAN